MADTEIFRVDLPAPDENHRALRRLVFDSLVDIIRSVGRVVAARRNNFAGRMLNGGPEWKWIPWRIPEDGGESGGESSENSGLVTVYSYTHARRDRSPGSSLECDFSHKRFAYDYYLSERRFFSLVRY